MVSNSCSYAIVILLSLGPWSVAAAQDNDRGLVRLEREMARLAELSGGTVGAAAIHLETGREAYHNGGTRFPMASSY